MGRRPAKVKPKRLPLTVIEQTHKILEILVETGGYGNNPTEAARIIIAKHIQELDGAEKIRLFKSVSESTAIDTE